jgi:hypothetical protein
VPEFVNDTLYATEFPLFVAVGDDATMLEICDTPELGLNK